MLDPASFAVHTPRRMWTDPRLPGDAPRHRIRPRRFDRETLKGVSDHFPVTARIEVLPRPA